MAAPLGHASETAIAVLALQNTTASKNPRMPGIKSNLVYFPKLKIFFV